MGTFKIEGTEPRRWLAAVGAAAAAMTLLAATVGGTPDQSIEVTVDIRVRNLDNPVDLQSARDGTGRLFALEKRGRIVVIHDIEGAATAREFMDVQDRVETSNSQNDERGLLGLAFHPEYSANGRFYVNYTGRRPGGLTTIVSRFEVDDSNPNEGDEDTEQEIIEYRQPFGNHNGGGLAFGPDGYLYIASGDGGSRDDPQGNGQNRNTLLGTLLRLDVDGAAPYAVPETNPFVGEPMTRPEIWAYGLRNPWRFSFDREGGDLYIADVGQNLWEEVNHQPADSAGGENYGWNIMEASSCFGSSNCDRSGLVLPVAEYNHSQGCSVTGGYVYRGARYPAAVGAYFYADYCSRRIWALTRNNAGQWQTRQVGMLPIQPASFGEDENGELYVVGGGQIGHLRLGQESVATQTPTDVPPATATPTEDVPTPGTPETPETPETPATPGETPTATATTGATAPAPGRVLMPFAELRR